MLMKHKPRPCSRYFLAIQKESSCLASHSDSGRAFLVDEKSSAAVAEGFETPGVIGK